MPETQSFVSLVTRIAISQPAPRPSSRRRAWSPPCARSGGWPRRAAPGPPCRSCRPGGPRTGTVGLIWANASIRPLATSSQRVMPPKMLNSTAVTFSLERITSTALRDRLGARAAARVEEVRGRAAGLGDDVQRRHHEPGAVAEDADVAVELDERQAALAGHLLLRVLGRDVAQRGVVRVAEERVVVERHLRVQRRDLAVGRDDQRVDLDEHRLFLDEGVVEPGQQRAERADDVGVDAGLERQPAGVEVLEAEQRVDVQAGDRVGVASRRPPRCPCRPAWRASPAGAWRSGRRRSTRSTRTRSPTPPRSRPRGPCGP